MHWHHDRDAAGLLFGAPSDADASLWLHTTGDWRAVRVRRCGTGHESGPHGGRRGGLLQPGQGCRLQDRHAHDARFAERRHGARPGPVRRVLFQSAFSVGRAEAVSDAGDPRHGAV